MKNLRYISLLLSVILQMAVGNLTWADDSYISLGNGDFLELDKYVPGQKTKVYMVARLTSDKPHGCLFGNAGETTESYGLIFNDSNDKMLAYTGGTKWSYHELFDITKNKKYYITYQIGSVTVDEMPEAFEHKASKTWSYVYEHGGPKGNLTFGARHQGTGYDSFCAEDVFEIKVTEGNKVICHLFPARYEERYGFMDIRNGVFHNLRNAAGQVVTGRGNVSGCKEHKYVSFSEDRSKVTCMICDTRIPTNEWAAANKAEYGITTVDPYLDVQAGADDAGQQVIYVTSTGKMSSLEMVDADTNERLASQTFPTPVTNTSVTLPSTDKLRTVYAIPYVEYGQATGSGLDTIMVYAPAPVTVKPFHTISALEITDSVQIDDKTGLATHYPRLRWAMDNVKDGDVMEDDQFIIQRAYTKDFSDAVNIDAIDLSVLKSTKDNTEVDGVKRSWYSYTDTDDGSQYSDWRKDTVYSTMPTGLQTGSLSTLDRQILNGYYDYPDRRVYYRVVRAIVFGMWKDKMGSYAKSDYAKTANLLPVVTAVDVEKTQNWSNDKKVKVTVKLANPYPWQYNPLQDSVAVKAIYPDLKKVPRRYSWNANDNATIRVHRYSPEVNHYQGQDDALKDYVITADEVKWDNAEQCYKAVIEDCQSLPYLYYYYSAIVDTTRSAFPLTAGNQAIPSSETMAKECYSATAALISNFSATRDSVKGKVLLEWEMGSGLTGKLYLKRQDIASGEIKSLPVSNTQQEYTDLDVLPGHVYRYTLSDTLLYRGNQYVNAQTAIGWESFYGTLKGTARMTNGTGIAGANVIIKRVAPIDIPDVYDEDGRLILKGIHEGLAANIRRNAEIIPAKHDTVFMRQLKTNERGEWALDSALYSVDAAKYLITINYGGADFVYNGNQTTAEMTLSNSCCEYSNIDFVCQSEATLKGRVLYEKSTVPVRGATFELNGRVLYDANGKAVTTDQSGNFDIRLPRVPLESLKVVKEGHAFKDGGYIRSAAGEISYEPETHSGMTIWDATKVRLVGRICGGGRQAAKPLGFALSQNNLGDNLTMVLQLEGDNTANIVYLDETPDSTSISYDVCHPFATARQKAAQKNDSTLVTYEKKRIVIKPSTATGEFFADLFPAKYKVIQLSANGYSSLFAEGEGFEILDLTDCTTSRDSLIEIRNAENQDKADTIRYAYHALYKRVYHTPVNTTLTQFTRGRAVDYYGEESMTETNLLGESVRMPLTGKEGYTFGYPVFESGNRYTMQVRAHEDYYYNGTGDLERVYLDSGELIVRNGLADNMQDKSYMLDSLGTATIYVDANNTAFALTGEDALRQLNMSVKINGYYYESAPLRGFVTGVRKKGEDMICDGGLTVVDILRDPYGSKSFSFRENGTNYEWVNEYTITNSLKPTITATLGTGGNFVLGTWVGVGAGALAGLNSSNSVSGTASITIPIYTAKGMWKGNYSLSLNNRIETSADEFDQGAMSDVYIGQVNTLAVGRVETVTMIDAVTYGYSQQAIRNGNVRILSEGKDADGNSYYLAIGEKITASPAAGRTFAYSQKYITGTLLPEYYNIITRKLLYGKTREELQTIADANQEVYYLSHVDVDDERYGTEDTYEPVKPKGWGDEKISEDEVQKCILMIKRWKNAIAANEKEKLDAYNKSADKAFQRYSIAGTTVSYSESSSYLYSQVSYCDFLGTNGGWNFGVSTSGVSKQAYNSGKTTTKEATYEKGDGGTSTYIDVPGLKLNFSFSPGFSVSNDRNKSGKTFTTASSGYTIGTNDNGYMTMDVYADTLAVVENESQISWISGGDNSLTVKNGQGTGASPNARKLCNYIFIPRAGAVRSPWIAPDSTLFYQPGTPLAARMMKIDNPKLYISDPVVNNQPGDEAATFQIRLTNEGELTQNTQNFRPTTLILYVNDGSNTKGAKISIDGEPLTSGREFVINPGQTLEKTLEVARGATGYDYDNLQLVLADKTFSLSDSANISVHYVPTSTPLAIRIPTDKWVLNTLSEPDEEGYYLPVEISGFSTHYDNFDHIALQYKKQTEGNAQWVTLCNWYNDSTYYNMATGVKRMFQDSETTLKYSFHGEKDPMEMKYDLRAVSYCRLSNGYVTRASALASGTKDTRCPEVFGMPTPASGILTYEDVIQMNFTEPIAYNYLDETANFRVTGYTNNIDISTENTLHFNGKDDQKALTSVSRNLNRRSFTVDMLVQADEREDMTLFSHGNASDHMSFGLSKDGCLKANISGTDFKSEQLANYNIDVTKGLTHVGMIYRKEEQDVQFFAGTTIIKSDGATGHNTADYTANGPVCLGNDVAAYEHHPFRGKMLEVRLWGSELSDGMISKFNRKHLNGYESQLIAHWPMIETQGTVVKDDANGANLTLYGDITWDNVSGYALKTTGSHPVAKLDAQLLATSAVNDYTLMFWFKVDKFKADCDSIALLTVGDSKLPEKDNGRLFIGFKGENFQIVSNGNTFVQEENTLLKDNTWHHFAMTVDRSTGLFSAYIDTKLAFQDNAGKMDGLASDYAALGDQQMEARFDVFSEWDLALPGSIIKELYNTRLSGKEMGLHVYLPFTRYDKNDQGIYTAFPCDLNCTYVANAKGEDVISSKKIIVDGIDAQENLVKDANAPIRNMPELEKLDFSWSSTGTALQVNINTPDNVINKQNIYVTVRGVEDECGNVMRSPRMLTYYVDKNVLKWDTKTIELECREGQADTISLGWTNKSGQQLSYTIDNAPDWMRLSTLQGVASPLEEKEITTIINSGLSAGKYTQGIYITDENGLSDCLTLNLTVKPSDCTWSVDKTRYDRTMSLRAVVQTRNCNGSYVIDDDPSDKVAAFIENDCVGVANITKDDDGAYLLMTIYGDSHLAHGSNDRTITFLLWNHETGKVSELKNVNTEANNYLLMGSVQNIEFLTNSVAGLPGDTIYHKDGSALMLRTTDKKEQTIHMNKGWNWISMNVSPEALNGINTIFINPGNLFSDGDVIKHVDFTQYSEDTRDWMGTLSKMDYKNVFQVYVNNAGDYKLMGREIDEDSLLVGIKGGAHGLGLWNDLPYLLSSSTTLEYAMADFQIGDKAQVGDIIKGYDQFAVATMDGSSRKWIGTLKYMEPGKGYYLYHHGRAEADKVEPDTIRYIRNTARVNTAKGARRMSSVTSGRSSCSMPLIACFAKGDERTTDDRLCAYIAGEKVAEAEQVAVGDSVLLFMSIPGEGGEKVTLTCERDGEIIATASTQLTMQPTGIEGSLTQPYVVDFDATVIWEGDEYVVYDLQGRRLPGTLKSQRQGLYITNGKTIVK